MPVRSVATRAHRKMPMGWTSPEVSELTGVSKRTLQHWRKTGFFVPALPWVFTRGDGYEPGELYSLGDVIAIKVIDMLRATPVERDVLGALAHGFTLWDPD